jgi:sugar phosphate isomerase/epimerase
MTNRRSFIRNTGLFAVGLPLLRYREWDEKSSRKLPALGVQLYMVKEDMEKDPGGTLSQLHAMGYTQIESFGGNKGIFWGMTHKEFNHLVTDNGLELVSSHYAGDNAGFEKTAALAAEIGMKYLIYPWKGPQKNIDDFKKIADEFNGYGSICKKYGLRFAYHPHDYPYRKVNGQLPINVLLEHTDLALVDFEMDFYYPVTAGLEPGFYIEKYKPRFRLCHMRDVLKERLPAGSDEESATDLGKGMMNYPRLLSLAMNDGMLYYFVEQSRFFHETPLQSAKVNADYLRKQKLI